MKALAKGICGGHLVLDVEDVVRVEGDIVLLLAEGKYVRLTKEGNMGICFWRDEMSNKYRHWVHLSAEGVKELGHIFKDGIVPVKCFLSAQATLGDKEQIKAKIYLIDLKQLTEEQVDLCCEYAGSLQGVPGCVVKRDICRSGELPIREKQVSGSGTSDVSIFL